MSATWEVGDAVPLLFTVAVNGTPTAATVTLTVTLPDASVITPTITNPTLGTYAASFVATLNGMHVYRWAAAGAVVDVNSDSFMVGGIVSLTDAKRHLNYPTPDVAHDDDTEVQGFIDAATEVAEFYCGALIPRPITETQYNIRSDRVLLAEDQVLAVSSISVQPSPAAAATSYDASSLSLDSRIGLVRVTSGTVMCGDVTIVYTAGRSSVPRTVRLGVLDLIKAWWQGGQQGSDSGGGPIGRNGRNDYDMVDVAAGPYSGVPYSVIEKFRPYFRAPRVG